MNFAEEKGGGFERTSKQAPRDDATGMAGSRSSVKRIDAQGAVLHGPPRVIPGNSGGAGRTPPRARCHPRGQRLRAEAEVPAQ